MHTSLLRLSLCTGLLALVATAGCSSAGEVENREPMHHAVIDRAVAGALNRMPSLAVSGNRVVVAWTATVNDVMDVYAATSEDAGATFSTPRRIIDSTGRVSANAEQPPRVAISGDIVTVIWPSRLDDRSVIRMSRSVDGGRTFSTPAPLAGGALTGLRGWQSMTPGRGGAVHAVWLDGRHADPLTKGQHHHGAKGGHHGAATRREPNQSAPRQDVYSAIITEDGSTSEAHVARDVCFCCKTAVGLGPGGRVYVAWRHIFPESMRDIALAVSDDGGRTFGPAARVSNDRWKLSGCPDDGPALAVDRNGTVHLAWPSVIDGESPRKAVFYSTTTDGDVFAPREALSGNTEDAGHPQIAADGAGNITAAWDEQTGDRRAIVVRVRANGDREFGSARVLNPAGSGFHPFVAGLERGFLVAWPEGSGKTSAIQLQRVDP
jgi:hypothetical protein